MIELPVKHPELLKLLQIEQPTRNEPERARRQRWKAVASKMPACW
jgi:hypothetical protein